MYFSFLPKKFFFYTFLFFLLYVSSISFFFAIHIHPTRGNSHPPQNSSCRSHASAWFIAVDTTAKLQVGICFSIGIFSFGMYTIYVYRLLETIYIFSEENASENLLFYIFAPILFISSPYIYYMYIYIHIVLLRLMGWFKSTTKTCINCFSGIE